LKKDAAAPDVSHVFNKDVVRLHGLPESIISDRDRKFTGEFWTNLMKIWGVRLRMSTSYHPQTDGQSERVIQILEHMLRCYVSHCQDRWEEMLPMLEFAYNNSVSTVTGMTPFYMNYGFHPRTPTSLDHETKVPALDDWLAELERIQLLAKDCVKDAQENAQYYANQHRRELTFKEGEKVYLSTKNLDIKNLPPAHANSLRARRIGPFKIIEVKSPVAYKLELPESMKCHPVFHVSLLSPYYSALEHFPDRTVPERPPALEVGGTDEWEVEEILGERLFRNRHPEFLVKWKGFPDYESPWESEQALENAPEIVEAFKAKQGNTTAVLEALKDAKTTTRHKGKSSRKNADKSAAPTIINQSQPVVSSSSSLGSEDTPKSSRRRSSRLQQRQVLPGAQGTSH
jgi:hypothetical protein